MAYDVVVAGAGVCGLITAMELQRAGCRVCVLESGRAGRESSWAGGGILSPLYPWRDPDAVNALAQWSTAYYPEYCRQIHADTGIDPQWLPSGLLILDDLSDHDSEAALNRWRAAFAVDTRPLRQPALRATEAALSPRFEVALELPHVGQVRNPRLLKALIAQAGRLGIELREHCPLIGVRVDTGRVTHVETPTDAPATGRLLIAAGAWSGALARFSLPAPAVAPVKGQMLQFQTTAGAIKHIALFDDHYVIPRKDGKILVGSTLEPGTYDKTPTATAKRLLAERAADMFPLLKDAPIINHWAGLRPGIDRPTPYICRHPDIANLYYNTGHYRNGIALAPASARLCADIMLEREPILPPRPYGWAQT